MWLKGGAGKLKFVSHWACLLSPVGSEIYNVPAVCGSAKSQRRHWHIRYRSSIRSMFGWTVSSALSWIFPVNCWQLDGFWICGSEKIWQRTWKWRPHRIDRAVNLILFFIQQNHNEGISSTRSVRVKYVVCSPTMVALNLTELLSSTVWRSFHSLAAKKLFEELHRRR